MVKRMNVLALGIALGFLSVSCSSPSVTGTWIEPASEGGLIGEKGFTLLENGEIIPINMGYAEFQSWEKQGNVLYFKGKYTGTNPHDFVDTMKIVKLDAEQMVLEQAGYTITYQRK